MSKVERVATMEVQAPAAQAATSEKRPLEDRYIWVVTGVALAAALTMVLVVFRQQDLVANGGDPYGYGEIAHHFVEHGFDRLTRRAASLYPTFLSLVYGVGAGDFVVQLIHVCLHVGTSVMVFSLGRHLYNARTGLIAGIVCALHPMLLRYVADLHMETWLTFWCTLTVWRAVRFNERPSVVNGILMGITGVIATLSKGVILPIVVAYAAVWFVRGLRDKAARANLFGVVALGATMAVLIAPWTYRNYQVSHRFVLLTPGTPDAFLRGYIFTRMEFATLQRPPYTYAEQESNALFRRIAAEAGTTWELDEVADDDNNGRVMKRMIIEHPFDTVRKVVVGMFTFWYEMTSLKNSLVPASLALVSWILAFVGFKRARAEGRPFWLLVVPVVALNVFVAILVPLGRYSVPILPCLSILAAFGVDTLLERWKTKPSLQHAHA
jgi:4-amino-4-deoxy-L-arabinose transferase-like glycosyltransferase